MAKVAQNIKNLYDVYNGDSRRFLPVIAGNTPFGFYDNDTEFVRDARRVCGFVAIHLGIGGLKLTPIKAVSDMTVLASCNADSYPVGMDMSEDGKTLIVTAQGKPGGGGNSVMVFKVTYGE